jgi:nucleoid-associated protein YgaU
MQAAVLLIGGISAAFLFGGGSAEPQPAWNESQPALVRRVAPPPSRAEAPATQLLGYVNETQASRSPVSALSAIGISARTTTAQTESAGPVSARPEPRTASQIGAAQIGSAPLAQLDAPPRLEPAPVLTAASGPAPRATMRPFAATAPTLEVPRQGMSATPTNAARKHVVRDGDTLGGLAEQYYGDARRYKELFAANRDVLSNPELLPIGVTLQIPTFDPTALPEAAPPTGARLLPQVLFQNP